MFLTVTALTLFALTGSFEGELHLDIKVGNKQQMNGTMLVGKTGSIRIDAKLPGANGKPQQMTMIVDQKNKRMVTVLHEKKQYLEFPMPPEPPKTAQTKTDFDPNQFEIKLLGTKKILGRKTQHVYVKDKKRNSEAEMWLSDILSYDELSHLLGPQQSARSGFDKMAAAFKAKGIKPGFPLKMIGNEPGRGKVVMEVTKFKRRKLAAASFQPPSDYKQMFNPLGAMMKSMGNGKMTPEQMKAMQEQLKQQMQRGGGGDQGRGGHAGHNH